MNLKISLAISILLGSLSTPAWADSHDVLDTPATYNGIKHQRVYLPHGDVSFADEAFDYKVGKKKPENLWRDPHCALGAPDFKDFEEDRVSQKPHFLGLGSGGSVIFRFADNALVDGPGPDLFIFEPGNVATAVTVEISRDGKEWLNVGEGLETSTEIDISKVAKPGEIYNFVRVTDCSKIDDADVWPGADIDAIAALNTAHKISFDDKGLFESDGKTLKSTAAGELKRVSDVWPHMNANKLIMEVYGPSEAGKKVKEETLMAQANIIKDWLVKEGKVPADKIVVKAFANAQSIAHRDVATEREKDSRIEVTILAHDRGTAPGGMTNRPIELVDGKWDSNEGFVIFAAKADKTPGTYQISGEWQESPGRVAIIQDGKFNPKNGQLEISWFRKYNNTRGSAKLQLTMDGKEMRGNWKADTGEGGEWMLTREAWQQERN